MSGYKKPKTRIHREFIYLDDDTIINSLSAFEAGKVDEIIEKVSEASEGGREGSLGHGSTRVAGNKKKTSNVEEELKRTRTAFSAFDAWSRHLDGAGAFGHLDDWDVETRDELGIGDTVVLHCKVSLAPLQHVFLAFIAYVNEAGNPDSALKQPTAKVAELKKQARMMSGWMRGKGEDQSVMVYLSPMGISQPRIIAKLEEKYLVGGTQSIEGEFTVVAQVESRIESGESVPAIRVVRDIPPTDLEQRTITEGMKNMIEPARKLGVEVSEDDISLKYPAVIVHPIAIYR